MSSQIGSLEEARQALNEGDWKTGLLYWARSVARALDAGTYHPKDVIYARSVVRVARKLGEETEALQWCERLVFATVTTLIKTSGSMKRYPKLTVYYFSKCLLRKYWLRKRYGEWLLQWAYNAFAGRLHTIPGLVRLFLSFGVGANLCLQPLTGCATGSSGPQIHTCPYAGSTTSTSAVSL